MIMITFMIMIKITIRFAITIKVLIAITFTIKIALFFGDLNHEYSHDDGNNITPDYVNGLNYNFQYCQVVFLPAVIGSVSLYGCQHTQLTWQPFSP